MLKLRLYNSLSNALEDFIPIDKNNVRLYACGPTVYSSPHIGNARPIVVFDVLFRVLRALYPNVTYVRNITDVDDKINNRAKERGISIRELTDEVIAEFHDNLSKLNVLPVSYEPRATEHIPDMLQIIKLLIERGFAYQSYGHVLFRVNKLNNYGSLSKRRLEDMIAGSRVEIAPYKEDPMDFVLWKPSVEGMPAWDSPFGAGRPGWHLECSAMSKKYLGETFDIHAGGHDLIFPHHENELAQNFGAFGCVMANYWVHNGMLLVDGQKMSKSLGNIISLQDILSEFNGEVVRYVLLSSHFQKSLNWTDQAVTHARQSLNRLYGALKMAQNNVPYLTEQNSVLEALCNNLNTPLAIQRLHQIADNIYTSTKQQDVDMWCATLRQEAQLLGLLQDDCHSWRAISITLSEEEIMQMIEQRKQAKLERNYPLADKIRAYLLERNIQIEDTKDGTTWRAI